MKISRIILTVGKSYCYLRSDGSYVNAFKPMNGNNRFHIIYPDEKTAIDALKKYHKDFLFWNEHQKEYDENTIT